MKITRESMINAEEWEKFIANSWYVIRSEKEALICGNNDVFEKMYLSHFTPIGHNIKTGQQF